MSSLPRCPALHLPHPGSQPLTNNSFRIKDLSPNPFVFKDHRGGVPPSEKTMSLPANIAQCNYQHLNGLRCGSPALRISDFCYWHEEVCRSHNLPGFPTLDSPEAIQVGVMSVIDCIMRGLIKDKQAGLILYALQIASSNLRRMSKPADLHEALVTQRHESDQRDHAAEQEKREQAKQREQEYCARYTPEKRDLMGTAPSATACDHCAEIYRVRHDPIRMQVETRSDPSFSDPLTTSSS